MKDILQYDLDAYTTNDTITLLEHAATTTFSFQSGVTPDEDTLDFLMQNATATETPYVPYVLRPETYIVPVLFAFIFIVGVLGNGTLIVVFLGVRQMRNVPNTNGHGLSLQHSNTPGFGSTFSQNAHANLFKDNNNK